MLTVITSHTPAVLAELQQEELREVTESQWFARSKKLRQLLLWMAARAIAGVQQKPGEYVVGVEALGKPADFDPSYDVSVRQLKRRLCARLDEYYAANPHSGRLRIVCQRGFTVRFERRAAESAPVLATPCLVVLPFDGRMDGDRESLRGALIHGLLESGEVRVIGKAVSAQRQLSELEADLLVEGEVVGGSALAVRLVEAGSGVVIGSFDSEFLEAGVGPAVVRILEFARQTTGRQRIIATAGR